jgi:hypothetical protein
MDMKQTYAGVSGSLGSNFNKVSYKYSDEEMNSKINVGVGAMVGMKVNPLSNIGMFVREYGWTIGFKENEISAYTTTVGLYYSHVF